MGYCSDEAILSVTSSNIKETRTFDNYAEWDAILTENSLPCFSKEFIEENLKATEKIITSLAF